MDAYRKNHGGEPPKELFTHGKTKFDAEVWEGFREIVPPETNVVCIRIRPDSSLKLFRQHTTNIGRGIAWIRSSWRADLWAKGFVPRLQTYAGREVPNPLLIEISRGEASIEQVMADSALCRCRRRDDRRAAQERPATAALSLLHLINWRWIALAGGEHDAIARRRVP